MMRSYCREKQIILSEEPAERRWKTWRGKIKVSYEKVDWQGRPPCSIYYKGGWRMRVNFLLVVKPFFEENPPPKHSDRFFFLRNENNANFVTTTTVLRFRTECVSCIRFILYACFSMVFLGICAAISVCCGYEHLFLENTKSGLTLNQQPDFTTFEY